MLLLRLGRLKRFARRKDGATALEFALIAPWFFMTLFGMLEIALVAFGQTNLDYAVDETARRIRTGQVQAQGLGASAIRDEVCANLRRIMPMNCANLYIDVDRYADFNSAGGGAPIVNGNFNQAGIGYTPTLRNEIVLVRGYYEWKFLTPMFQPILGNLSNGRRLLASSVLFRNEPF
ncbi:MAG: pilus assembly protein [Hyphomonadaceae bacterium]|nr:pilus assembly protein [Hyphomonadaceae bacterium]